MEPKRLGEDWKFALTFYSHVNINMLDVLGYAFLTWWTEHRENRQPRCIEQDPSQQS